MSLFENVKGMYPKVIIHNSISLDGSLTGFQPNMGLHYQIAGNYEPEVHLIGSNTVRTGIELFGNGVQPEVEADFEKSKRDKNLPYWIVLDTKGVLKGLLHSCRRFEFCRDVAVLISETTPREYVEYLEKRNYDYFTVGNEHIDLAKALKLLSAKFKAKTVLTDTGRILGNLLMEQGLVNEISLLVHPVVVGEKSYNLFGNVKENPQWKLRLQKQDRLDDGCVWLVYKVING